MKVCLSIINFEHFLFIDHYFLFCRIKKHFINKQAKSKDEIDQLKRKVEHYEEQLQEIKQGRGGSSGDILLSSHIKYNKVRNHFSRIRHLG